MKVNYKKDTFKEITNLLRDARILNKEIESIEEEGDDIKDSAFDKLYHFAPELQFLQFFHYSEMLHKCDDLLDNSEDLADIIVSIITSILK